MAAVLFFEAETKNMFLIPKGPQRIVCLTEEPTEILYALGEDRRIVGISAYTVRPPQAKQDKPIVSAFLDGSVKKISQLKPDLVIGFSDIQADLAKRLIAANLNVLIFNQRSIQEIFGVIDQLGGLVHQRTKARELIESYQAHLSTIYEAGERFPYRPKVYFEEWDDPTITAIEWVSELISIAGGTDVFHDKSVGKLAKDRFVTTSEIVATQPDVVFASWCGKPFDRDAFLTRFSAHKLPAISADHIYELPPEIILQPGPACLTDGVSALHANLAQVNFSQT